jgi:hypothetical protein
MPPINATFSVGKNMAQKLILSTLELTGGFLVE